MPDDVTVPLAGRLSPARIRVSVVLPAPLRPTRPMRSPAAIRKDTSSISRRAPARTSSWDTVITTRTFAVGVTPPDEGRRGGVRGPRTPSLRERGGAKGHTMRFNPKARIDQSQIETRSGGGTGGGGMRLPMPSGGGGKIGLGTVVVVILFVVLTQCTGILGDGSTGNDAPSANTCQSGEDANKSAGVRGRPVHQLGAGLLVAGLPRPDREAVRRREDRALPGLDRLRSAAAASAEMGPFYCPNDQQVYLDTTFFDDMLRASSAPRAGRSRSAT